jgi:nucleotide-binding universal stress UspA family protein
MRFFNKETAMHEFRKILFVTQGYTEGAEAITQAMSLARNNAAELDGLIVYPEIPFQMTQYKDRFEDSLKESLQDVATKVRATLGESQHDGLRTIEVDSGKAPALRVIRHALRHAYDLIVKQAEPRQEARGFNAVDMELLRESHCPLWLSRPITRHRNEIKVAVAIDPQAIEDNEHDLAQHLLRLARALADDCSGELHIVSCWDYPYEDYLSHNPWIRVSPEDLIGMVEHERSDRHQALLALIAAAGIKGDTRIHHLRGRPEQIIPAFVAEDGVDILVMGTLARTGIPGFVMGNTAENILQKLTCSVLALKPNGFVSPVKAY